LAKKTRRTASKAPAPPKKFTLENSPWFAPLAFVAIFVAVLFLFGDFIFSDQMLMGSDTIQAGIFFRSMLVDHYNEFGAVPQWNPYIFCGMPYVEAFHGDIFYPLSLMKYVGPIHRMLGLILVMHIFLAGVFMYLAARRFRLSKIASLMSGVCYMFAAYLVSLVAPGHDGKIFVTALFPLMMYFLEGGFRSSGLKSFFQFSMLGAVIGFIILSPHPQMSYFSLWALALYAAFRLFFLFRESGSIKKLIQPTILTTYAVVIGLFLSAIQFYPGYIYTSEYSPRGDSKQGWEWATSWSMHEEEAFSLLIPEFAGASSQSAGTYYWGKNAFKDNSESVGVVGLFIALIGLFFSRRKTAWFFGGLGLFALIYALGATTPLFYVFYSIIPKVSSLRAPSMIMFLFSFSIALLAGMGIQYLRDGAAKTAGDDKKKSGGFKLEYILLGLPGLLLLVALWVSASPNGFLSFWSSLFYSSAPTQMVAQGISKLDLAFRHAPHIKTGAWMAFLFTAAAAAIIYMFRERKFGVGVLLVLIALPVIDGVRFNSRFIENFDAEREWSPNAGTEFLLGQSGNYRTMMMGGVREDWLPYFGIEVVVGYHGNQLRWYDELLGGIGAGNKTNPRLLNLASARHIVLPAQMQVPPGYFGQAPVTDAVNFPGPQGMVKVAVNENAFPRVYLADQYEVISDRSQIYPRILQGNEDLRRLVYLEKQPDLAIGPPDTLADSIVTDSAWIENFHTDSIVVGLSNSKNQLLVMTDNWYDAWHAEVDGQPVELLRSYGTFRAVEVPAGAKQVVFRYESERYATGVRTTYVTAAFLLVVCGVYGYGYFRRRPEESETEE